MTDKKLFFVGLKLSFLVFCIMMIAGCEGEKGPMGPPGPEGPSGAIDCFNCHNDDSGIPRISAQWEKSIHASGTYIQYMNATNQSFCGSYCHTHEGFVSLIEADSLIDVDNPSAIGCFTCHAPHTKKNFNMRTQSAYTLENGAAFDMGNANICANCHHATEDVNTYVTDPTTFSSWNWGPHSSAQTDILAGENGYEYPDYFQGYGNSHHTVDLQTMEGCIFCHMKQNQGYTLGGHSWNMRWNEDLNLGPCRVSMCHMDLKDFNHRNGQSIVIAYLDTLGKALINAGLIDSNFTPVTHITTSADSAGAVWNFLLVSGDRSNGVHNTNYARALLRSSLMFLRGKF